jgi:hypothetical protein
VFSQLPDMTYSTEKTIQWEDRTEQLIKESCIQLNFAIMVDYTHRTIFRVNPSEHSTGIWASQKMLGELEMTEQMRELVSVALEQSRNFFTP